MHGSVLSFRPPSGRGAIVTQSGRIVPFVSRLGEASFAGGDLVVFEMDVFEDNEARASRVRLIQRWSDRDDVAPRGGVGDLFEPHPANPRPVGP